MLTIVLENKHMGGKGNSSLPRLKQKKPMVPRLERESSANKALAMQASGPEFGPQHLCKILGVNSCDPHNGVVETEGSLRLAE